jgi:hypothetical protein
MTYKQASVLALLSGGGWYATPAITEHLGFSKSAVWLALCTLYARRQVERRPLLSVRGAWEWRQAAS